jgi:hypothetical protein
MKHILQNSVLMLFMLSCPILSLAQVCPEDFEGRYSLVCDGNKGVLEITKQKSVKNISYFDGYYIAENKKTYIVKGEVNHVKPNEIVFTIEFPRPKGFNGYLMDKTMDTITGHTLTKKPVGFFAARIAPISKVSKIDAKKGAAIINIGIIKAVGRASSSGTLTLVWEYGSGEMPASLEIDICSEGKSIILSGGPVTVAGSITQAEINVRQVLCIPHEIVCYLHYPPDVVPGDKIFVADCRIGEKTACLPTTQPASIIKIDIPEVVSSEMTSFAKMIMSWEYGEGELPVSLTIDIQRNGGTVLPMGELITVNGAETQKEISIWRLFDLPHDIIFYARYPYGTIPREKMYTFKQKIKK